MKLLLLILLIGCSAQPYKATDSIKLVLLHTNDHHGHFLKDSKGQAGMAARKTLVDQERLDAKKAGAFSLLLSGGDINTGTMESDLFDAEPDFKGMNIIGYDAMAVGNHEFDNSFKTILHQQKLAGFPFLSANIYWKNSNKRAFDKPLYIVKNFRGIKVGIFGLTTTDTPFKASHPDAKNLFEFRKPSVEAQKVVDILKQKEKVDFIITVTHMGHDGSDTSQGDINLASETSGIDVIVGGHSQEIIRAEKVKDTIVVQAQEWGKYLGKLELEISKKKWRANNYTLIPVNLKEKINGEYKLIEKEIKEYRPLVKMFEPYKKKVEELSKEVLGTLDQDLSGDRFKVRTRPMGIGQLLGHAMIELANVEAAVVNGGGLRATLKAGEINRKDLHAVHPYNDTIIAPKLSAKEFFDYIQKVSVYLKPQSKSVIGGYPHFVGMQLIYKGEELSKIKGTYTNWEISKTSDGKIKSNKKYVRFAISKFLANGGDSYPDLAKHKGYLDTGFSMSSALESYIKKRPTIKASKYTKQSKASILKIQ